jgi:hypothetical protein
MAPPADLFLTRGGPGGLCWYIRIGVPPARVSRPLASHCRLTGERDGVRLRRVRQAHRGGRAPPHARPPILHHRQGTAQRPEGHCSPLRGDLPLRGPSLLGSHLTDCPPWWTQSFPSPHPCPLGDRTYGPDLAAGTVVSGPPP